MMVEFALASFGQNEANIGFVWACLSCSWGCRLGVGRRFWGKKRVERVVRVGWQKDYCNGAGKAVQEQAIRARPDGEVESGVAGGEGRA